MLRVVTGVAVSALALAAFAAAGCGSDHSELAEQVDGRCRWNAATLRGAVEEHRQGADFIAGVGDVTRGDASTALFRDFSFCAMARRADPDEMAKLSAEFQGLAGDMARSRDHAGRQTAMEKMVELYERVNRLPIKR